ncbi:hypothetical protein ARMGADRAFT_1086736 [Armillaria gallica]|uniref:Uncharacterized protein n=1 Tax=Armillaria gallica TaxID=47427 RepID=A0A2H3CTA0_ARMGA|nr:hypothetical protein ARMGADRAFT_1086736 [Armillaria gallica]
MMIDINAGSLSLCPRHDSDCCVPALLSLRYLDCKPMSILDVLFLTSCGSVGSGGWTGLGQIEDPQQDEDGISKINRSKGQTIPNLAFIYNNPPPLLGSSGVCVDTLTESPSKECSSRCTKPSMPRHRAGASPSPSICPFPPAFGPPIYETVMPMMIVARLETAAVSSDLAIDETTFVGRTTCHHPR